MAAPQGFEPRYADPESAVLPLNEGATTCVEANWLGFARLAPHMQNQQTYHRGPSSAGSNGLRKLARSLAVAERAPMRTIDGPKDTGLNRRIQARSSAVGTRTDVIPAAVAASIPISVSSNTRQSFASMPSRVAAVKKQSGAGLPRS